MEPDFKEGPRIKDPELMRQAHWAFDECVVCGSIEISIHHILSRSQGGDDVWPNLLALCGSGTHGCHGGVEHELDSVCRAVGLYIVKERLDTVDYLIRKLRPLDSTDEEARAAASEFLRRRYRVAL